MPAQATNLDLLPRLRQRQQVVERGLNTERVSRHTEVRPLKMVVWPRRIPTRIQVQAEIGLFVSGLSPIKSKGHGRDRRAVREHDPITMLMQLDQTMIVVGIDAPPLFVADNPMQLTLGAHFNGLRSHGSDPIRLIPPVTKARATVRRAVWL